jgi:hypothetical protein
MWAASKTHPFIPSSFEEHEAFMSEIQLRGIVDKMAREASSQGTNRGEVMSKNGAVNSKFSRDALEIGTAVGAVILDKVRKVFDLNWGDDAVFRVRNGAPKIMTKFKDKPYSYELLPEYANGSKKFSTVKSMNWEGKSATVKVIRGFTESTPVVQRCPNPWSISRLVIVPKLSPGQAKDDPDHGFRVCVNALINKCIKPDASTIHTFGSGRNQEAGSLQVLPAAGWGKCILEYTGMRGKHEAHGISHPRWHILLESSSDGCQT